MPRYDFRTPRLYVAPALERAVSVPLDKGQANYLTNVLRLEPGDPVLVFNGRDGEWRAELQREGRKSVSLAITEQTRPQHGTCDLVYLFAPIKHARLDYMVQKAVELGVSRLQPVTTRHTQAARVNVERMQANAIEAAEQCGILTIAEASDAVPLRKALDEIAGGRVLIFCDEDAETRDPVAALGQLARGTPLAVLVGPEGGFADEERAMLLKHPSVIRLALGPRILRADTAAVAALTLVQAVAGDWR
jgi:16S rRNA (uracil1498-N3)-methyltransferase